MKKEGTGIAILVLAAAALFGLSRKAQPEPSPEPEPTPEPGPPEPEPTPFPEPEPPPEPAPTPEPSPTPPQTFYVYQNGRYAGIHLMGPDKARPGERFNVYVALLNWNFDTNKPFIDMNIYGEPVVKFNDRIEEGSYQTLSPVKPSFMMTEYGLWSVANSWKFEVLMPAGPVAIKADGWIEQEYAGIVWHVDVSVSKTIVPY